VSGGGRTSVCNNDLAPVDQHTPTYIRNNAEETACVADVSGGPGAAVRC